MYLWASKVRQQAVAPRLVRGRDRRVLAANSCPPSAAGSGTRNGMSHRCGASRAPAGTAGGGSRTSGRSHGDHPRRWPGRGTPDAGASIPDAASETPPKRQHTSARQRPTAAALPRLPVTAVAPTRLFRPCRRVHHAVVVLGYRLVLAFRLRTRGVARPAGQHRRPGCQ